MDYFSEMQRNLLSQTNEKARDLFAEAMQELCLAANELDEIGYEKTADLITELMEKFAQKPEDSLFEKPGQEERGPLESPMEDLNDEELKNLRDNFDNLKDEKPAEEELLNIFDDSDRNYDF